MPSGTTSGRPPTCGAPTARLSTTAGPTCQWFSPGQLTCDVGRKEAKPSDGGAGPPHYHPRLSVLWTWTGHAEVRQPCQEPGGGTGRPAPGPAGLAHLGVSSLTHKDGALLSSGWNSALSNRPCPEGMSTFVHTLDPQKQLFLKFSSPPLSPTQNSPTCRLPLPPFPAAFLGSDSGPPYLHVSSPAHTAVLALARGCRISGVLQGSSTRESRRGMSVSPRRQRRASPQ